LPNKQINAIITETRDKSVVFQKIGFDERNSRITSTFER
jgi:hypothetical protein